MTLVAVAGILALLGLLAAVVVVWFGYGLTHGPKDASTDLTVMLVTGVPYFGACWALWRLARRVEARLEEQLAGVGGDQVGADRL